MKFQPGGNSAATLLGFRWSSFVELVWEELGKPNGMYNKHVGIFCFRPSLSQTVYIYIHIWVVVSNIFYFQPYLGRWSILTNTFQRGWNHQLDVYIYIPCWDLIRDEQMSHGWTFSLPNHRGKWATRCWLSTKQHAYNICWVFKVTSQHMLCVVSLYEKLWDIYPC